MKRGFFGIVAIIVGIWVLLLTLKVAIKLIGLAILLGLGFLGYLFVKHKIGGGRAR